MKTNSFFHRRTPKHAITCLCPAFNSKWLILLIFLFAAGCKKVTEEKGTTGLCPIVLSTDPAHLAVDIPLSQEITALFNEAMDPCSITTSSFTLKMGTVNVPGVVTYTGMTATFSPAQDLV